MKVKEIPSDWLRSEGARLDVGPYMSGALEAKVLLEKLSARKDRLDELTAGHSGGIYNGPQFVRNYVRDPDYGVPFVSSGSMLKSDLTTLPFLSKKDAVSNKLSYLRLTEGTTLISCSGAIGRMVYVRKDMEGLWSSQDVLKVVPDPKEILSGFVYAYLSSKFGLPQVVSGTYGAIIQHLESHHIADLPVPRLGRQIESAVHDLVESASEKRSAAAALLDESTGLLIESLSISQLATSFDQHEPLVSSISALRAQSRLDAFYYSRINREARSAFDNAASELVPLSQVAEVFIPGIFKRRYADDPQHGYPYITGADVFQLAPTSEKYLMKSVAEQYQLVLKKGMILIQEAGQLGGLIGRSVQVGEYLDGFACTNNMVRVTPLDERDAGYLYSVLASPYGVRLISREAAGSSIPHIEVSRVQNLMIPWADEVTRRRIGEPAIQARQLRDEACDDESAARELVERAIEEAAA